MSFQKNAQGQIWQAKPAASVLDYAVDFTLWLNGEAIATATVTSSDVPITEMTNTADEVTFLAGADTVGVFAHVVVSITTATRSTHQDLYLLLI